MNSTPLKTLNPQRPTLSRCSTSGTVPPPDELAFAKEGEQGIEDLDFQVAVLRGQVQERNAAALGGCGQRVVTSKALPQSATGVVPRAHQEKLKRSG